MPDTYDHAGAPVTHGRARVNGIKMHYITSGSGPALLLLHGTPKHSFYWYKLLPLLTHRFTVVAPDLRGFGATDKPAAVEGYDSGTNAVDLAELMAGLGHETYYVHGEDRGAEYAYALAATQRERVLGLSFCEMLLSGLGLEESAAWTPENVAAQYEKRGVWCWHLPFFWLPHVPEMLIEGKEDEFWTHFMLNECTNPNKIEEVARVEFVKYAKQPGGTRGILETYRSAFRNAELNKAWCKEKLGCPVLTVGAPEFFGSTVKECAEKFAEKVGRAEIFEECGHSLSLEQEHRMAQLLIEFFLGG